MSDTELRGKILEVLTCPYCQGEGERVIESGGLVSYTCEACRGTGLVHPVKAKAIAKVVEGIDA
jgi:DnaJ-class molecular chaperone